MNFQKNVKGKGQRQVKDLDDEETPIQRPKTRNSAKVATSRKRKREEDLETAPPAKVLKGSGRKKADLPLEEPMRVSKSESQRNPKGTADLPHSSSKEGRKEKWLKKTNS